MAYTYSEEPVFYVYVWIRNDINEPFYVGKGKGRRCYDKRRKNKFLKYVMGYLERTGVGYTVIKLKENMTELEAYDLEKETISLYKSKGYKLTNIMPGGEGGDYVSSLTPEEKAEYSKRMSQSCMGKNKGHKHTEEAKRKMSIAASKRVGPLNPYYGHHESRKKKKSDLIVKTGKPQTEKQKKAASEGNKKGFCVLFSDNHKEVYSSRAEAVNNLSNRYSRFNDGVFRKFLLEDVKVEVELDYYIVGIYRLTDKKKNVLIDIDAINFDGNLDSLRTYAVMMKTIVATFNNGNELKFSSVNDCKEYFMTKHNISQYNMKKYLKSGEEFSIGNNESVYLKYT